MTTAKSQRGSPDMGIFTVEVGVGRIFDGSLNRVQALVDTGAVDSMFPASLLTRLNVAPMEQRQYYIADGSEVEYDVGMALINIDGREWHCPVIFGPENQYLLGATTLEIFNLVVDPRGGQLLPRKLYARPI